MLLSPPLKKPLSENNDLSLNSNATQAGQKRVRLSGTAIVEPPTAVRHGHRGLFGAAAEQPVSGTGAYSRTLTFTLSTTPP